MSHADATTPILVFDVNETLLDLTTLEPLFERLFGHASAMREWFAQLILYSQALTLAGRYVPFGALGEGSLRMTGAIHGVSLAEGDIDELRERIGSMPAHPDAQPALARLREAGFRLVTLTNSTPGASPTPLERAGLAGFFERSFSVDTVRRFKPAPETYRLVADELGVDTGALVLVACHLWDTIGAQAAGCRAALITRPGNALLPADGVPDPDLVVPGMAALADQIISRWGPR